MWAAYYNTPNAHPTLHRSKAEANNWTGVARSVRVAVIPLDDVEAIVERAADAYADAYRTAPDFKWTMQYGIRAALTAAGIPCKRKASK